MIPSPERTLTGRHALDVVRDVLNTGAAVRFSLETHHMCPCIKQGDLVTLSPMRVSSRVGDVVGYDPPNAHGLAIGRVVGRQKDSYLMRCDTPAGPIEEIPYAWILGYLSGIERDGRRVTFGLGPERVILGLMSRWGLLAPLLHRFNTWVR